MCTELNCWGKGLWHQTQWVDWLSIDKYGVEIMCFLLEEKMNIICFGINWTSQGEKEKARLMECAIDGL